MYSSRILIDQSSNSSHTSNSTSETTNKKPGTQTPGRGVHSVIARLRPSRIFNRPVDNRSDPRDETHGRSDPPISFFADALGAPCPPRSCRASSRAASLRTPRTRLTSERGWGHAPEPPGSNHARSTGTHTSRDAPTYSAQYQARDPRSMPAQVGRRFVPHHEHARVAAPGQVRRHYSAHRPQTG